MLPIPESACFIIADLSGYTRYLANVELDHAQDIIADLLGTVVRKLRPPFRLAKFEGDAAFLYAPIDRLDGSFFQDSIESAYFEFRRRLRNIKQATVCACRACQNMGLLDLKFVAHCGQFVMQKIAGRQELVGPDVILTHRLLKNDVSGAIGDRAYALLTDPCTKTLAIDAPLLQMSPHHETIDTIGDVDCWLHDLTKAWSEESMRQRHEIKQGEADYVLSFQLPAPRERVWEYFTSPDLRTKWRSADTVREKQREGRRGVGTVTHCMHGQNVVVEEILDWRPYDYLTLSTLLPIPSAPKIDMTFAFSEVPGGTSAEIRVGKVRPKYRSMLESPGAAFRNDIAREIAGLTTILQQEGLSQQPAEPAIPASAHRFLSEPVT